ncbi:MAG: DUF2207 domain-containing protein [Verrucomicrobiales bacterium]
MPRILSFLVFAAFALSAAADERILEYRSTIEVEKTAALLVTETVRVRAEGNEIRRGIYRDFPTLYQGKAGLRKNVGFEVVGVKRDGVEEPYHTEKQSNGIRVYVGDGSRVLSPGEYTYEIRYRTDRQLGFFDDHDELYWNVTGNGWAFPIDRVSATVRLPAGAEVGEATGYTGEFGSKEQAVEVESADGGVRFETTRRLQPREGMTIVVTWQKGIVTPEGRASGYLSSNIGLILGAFGILVVLGYYCSVWIMVGRDPEAGTIIPLYEPPSDFSPAAVRYLKRMGFDDKTFTSALIGIAVKGWMRIEEEDKDDYTLHKTTGHEPLTRREKKVFKKLFAGSRKTLAVDNANHATFGAAKRALSTSLSEEVETIYFKRNLGYWVFGLVMILFPMAIALFSANDPGEALFMTLWLSIWTVGVFVLVSMAINASRTKGFVLSAGAWFFALPFLAGELVGLFMLFHLASIWVVAIFVLGILIVGVFYHLMKAPTREGREVLDQIEGFKMYLAVAERDELKEYRPPEDSVEVYERYLPYALALDVEQEWSERFSSVLEAAAREAGDSSYRPRWYTGTSMSTIGAAGFASALNTSFSGAISSSSTAPGSSSGGGGGGSSGGGGGGGGGGGW